MQIRIRIIWLSACASEKFWIKFLKILTLKGFFCLLRKPIESRTSLEIMFQYLSLSRLSLVNVRQDEIY